MVELSEELYRQEERFSTVCETGFGRGHSSALLLEASSHPLQQEGCIRDITCIREQHTFKSGHHVLHGCYETGECQDVDDRERRKGLKDLNCATKIAAITERIELKHICCRANEILVLSAIITANNLKKPGSIISAAALTTQK